MGQQRSAIEIFGCYAHKDKDLLDELKKHLSLLYKQNVVNVWYDGNISAGAEWEQEIRDHLDNVQIILLLISPDFINSEYCYGIEMKHALKRHQANEARVIPILLRPVYWKGAPFAHLQILPTGARAITAWSNQDEAFADVVTGIRRVIEDLTCLTGLSDPAMSNTPELVPSTSFPVRQSSLIPQPPTQRNPLRKKRWLLVAIVTCVILLGIVGAMIVPMFSGANTAACMAAPTLTDPVDGQLLNSRTVTMTWEAPQGCLPDGYTVRISENYDPEAKPWIVDTGWAPTDYKYTFSTDGSYYWHIRACNPCTPFHPGNWVIRSFTILTASTP